MTVAAPVNQTEDPMERLPRIIRGQLYRDVLSVYYAAWKMEEDDPGYVAVKECIIAAPTGRWINAKVKAREFPLNFINKCLWKVIKHMEELEWVEKEETLTYSLTPQGKKAYETIQATVLAIQHELYLEMADGE